MALDKPTLFLATADAARSRTFYEKALGLKFVDDNPFALVFQVGPSLLRIQKVQQVSVAPYTALGWAVDDIRQTVSELSAAGVKFQQYEGVPHDADGVWRSPSGALVAWFQDPDGNILSATQHP
jgi:catechol 2,3-dioxygenase-like lactoylglutathione lyase family enzyme